MFPVSKITQKYGCVATKTFAIVNVLGPDMLVPVRKYLQNESFSLVIDGSSNIGTESHYPIVVRIFDSYRSRAATGFWHMRLACLRLQCQWPNFMRLASPLTSTAFHEKMSLG